MQFPRDSGDSFGLPSSSLDQFRKEHLMEDVNSLSQSPLVTNVGCDLHETEIDDNYPTAYDQIQDQASRVTSNIIHTTTVPL